MTAQRKTAQELAAAYGADAVEEAYELARQYRAKDPAAYAEKVLTDKYGDGEPKRNGASAPTRLLCDNCQLPAWLNDMVVRNGKGVCSECAANDVIFPPAGTPMETKAGLTADEVARIPADRHYSSRLQSSVRQQAWLKKREVLEAEYDRRMEEEWQSLTVPDEIRELIVSGRVFTAMRRMRVIGIRPKVTNEWWRTARVGLGPMPLDHADTWRFTVTYYLEPQPTPAARRVLAFWAQQEGTE